MTMYSLSDLFRRLTRWLDSVSGTAWGTNTSSTTSIASSFHSNMLAQVAASAAIKDTTYLGGVLENNDEGMRYLTNEFEKLGWEYVPSSTNFVMLPTKSAEKVKQIHDGLLREGVAIRPLAAFGLPHCFRITIGLPDENEACINALKKHY